MSPIEATHRRLVRLVLAITAILGLGCKPHVLVVGLDGANWAVLNPLIDAGYLPNIGYLIRNGATWPHAH